MSHIELQESVLHRINELTSSSFFTPDELIKCSSLTDENLLGFVYEKALAESSKISPREVAKLTRRAKAKAKFFEMIEKLGGTIKAKDVATLLGVSRQTVNNHLKAGKLLAICSGTDYLYPVFQFYDGAVNSSLIKLNQALPKELGEVSRVSFFINDIDDGGKPINPLLALKSKNISEDDWFRLLRSASLFASQTAR